MVEFHSCYHEIITVTTIKGGYEFESNGFRLSYLTRDICGQTHIYSAGMLAGRGGNPGDMGGTRYARTLSISSSKTDHLTAYVFWCR